MTPAAEEILELERAILGLRGRAWTPLDVKTREQVLERCFLYWRGRGFPHYRLTDEEIVRGYRNVARKPPERILLGEEIQMSMAGLEVANSFHPQMWGVPVRRARSPLERFENDQVLRRVLRRCLEVWPGRFSVNASNLRRMLTTFSHTARVSNFRPTAAKALYETWSGDGDPVLDFSAGYGGRLLGCAPLRRAYVGVDPCADQVRGLQAMIETLGRLADVQARADIVPRCAEDVLPGLADASFPLVFSSPPYFDAERYSVEPTQSYLRHPRYEEWVERFLGTVIAESARVLSPGGHLLINVADVHGYELTREVRRLAAPHLRLVTALRLRLGNKPYLRKYTGGCSFKYEPVFVFRKPRRTRRQG
ncbi:MAG TPA: hypothetical protein VH394_08840 [Thermoanaerobaculia bacterium]|jgi:SAM-dependent methyltransferase|nr:hypothetical protein [Thermoanaerobaculia bacterium]